MNLPTTLQDTLQTFFGFKSFKGAQEAIIHNILSGKDSFVIMPTGGGKSMCYQLPALMSEGTAIVISPLIALMKNQVDQVRSFAQNDSVAHFLNSSLNKTESNAVKEDLRAGLTKLLYLAPESLARQEMVDFLQELKVSFVAVDEAHCISEWGHDFRPEYRKIRQMIASIGEQVPVMALTATATPKVQQDIQKNLGMQQATVFKSSFNRSNLLYEVRPKKDELREIIRYIKSQPGKAGIIYCLSRKKVEEVAQTLVVNGIAARPYHAGLDAVVRAETQDNFLMEDAQVIVATIAFGMGIDKPDVRFVIHHDMPKSMEGYYQETGRAGRDGGAGTCIAFYSQKDMDKLFKFMRDKPVAEREIGSQILKEVVDYAESSVCRRTQLLHYFGESFDASDCEDMCDNCKNPNERFEAQADLTQVLALVQKLEEQFDTDHIINIIAGLEDALMTTLNHSKLPEFGIGKEKDVLVWKSVLRQAILQNYLTKETESYGILKMTEKGNAFLKSSHSIFFVLNHDYSKMQAKQEQESQAGETGFDEVLLAMLKELRKKIAKQKNIPPFVVFQDPSLEEMAVQYPITIDELKHINGVGQGKAFRFGKEFIELIKAYVEEHEIDRPQDLIFKSTVNKSSLKVSIIQHIDRQIPLEDIARSKGISMADVLQEIEAIVSSGTKVNLAYYIDEIMDEDRQDEVFDYFRQSESDSVDVALAELGTEDYSREEIQLMRIRFIAEFGN